ncbi:MAG: helix-turn-helix domain-containing protein [Acidobacteria bacterium]|nr:helix-turn-helix domain-containing protein [Acidobacteriota bacterium]
MQHTIFLTTSEAAKILRLTPASVRALERSGKMKALRTPSGVRIFRLEDVQRFLKDREAHREGRGK